MDYDGWCLYFNVPTIESPITRALSSGFSVGALLSGENLFDVTFASSHFADAFIQSDLQLGNP